MHVHARAGVTHMRTGSHVCVACFFPTLFGFPGRSRSAAQRRCDQVSIRVSTSFEDTDTGHRHTHGHTDTDTHRHTRTDTQTDTDTDKDKDNVPFSFSNMEGSEKL